MHTHTHTYIYKYAYNHTHTHIYIHIIDLEASLPASPSPGSVHSASMVNEDGHIQVGWSDWVGIPMVSTVVLRCATSARC